MTDTIEVSDVTSTVLHILNVPPTPPSILMLYAGRKGTNFTQAVACFSCGKEGKGEGRREGEGKDASPFLHNNHSSLTRWPVSRG